MHASRSPWRRQAEHDLERAKAALRDEAYDWAAYGAQQAVEKLLKHLMIRAGAPFERTHDLASLATGLRQTGVLSGEFDGLLDDLKELTQLNIVARYPLGEDATAPVDLVTRRQAERAIETADTAFVVADALERDFGGDEPEKREP